MNVKASLPHQHDPNSIPFSITAEKRADKAHVRIIGHIDFSQSEGFRSQVDKLVAAGVKDAHVYIHSPGGSVFDANEIVNIIKKFKGNITGEGGALVASAGTFIAIACKTFEMPENGMFMIHKPSGIAMGTASQIEGNLKLLKDLEQQYYDAYKAIAKDPGKFDEKWQAGDYWMTAKEAKEAGFITNVTRKVTIDKGTAAMIAACGYPQASAIVQEAERTDTNNLNKIKMEFIALLLGLKKDATEQEITAAIEKLKADAATAATLTAQVAEINKSQINAMVEAGIAAGKFTADKKEHFTKLGETAGVDTLRATLDAMQGAARPKDLIAPGTPGASATGKKWVDLTEKERIELRDNDRATFDALLAEYSKS